MTQDDQQAIFDDWLARYRSLLFKVVRAYSGAGIPPDDLFQEIAIQVWHSIPSFRQESSPATWIYRIALNTAIRWNKREQSSSPVENLEQLEHLLTETPNAIDDRIEWLYEAIRQLDPIDRSVTLLLLDGYQYKEMAQMLGISLSNVGVKINRIKKLLIIKSKKYADHGI